MQIIGLWLCLSVALAGITFWFEGMECDRIRAAALSRWQ